MNRPHHLPAEHQADNAGHTIAHAAPRTPVIIYARYSSDMQNDRSIEDQVASCRAALRPDERVVRVFEDRARSGAFMTGRTGIQALLADVRTESCAVILTESLDRLSRSLEDVAHIYRLARFHGVRIRTLMEDEISEMHICFNGAMASMQLQQTVERTRRGQIGNIRAGKAGGGLAYGYRVRHLNDAGEPEAGLREIDPEQAAVVRRVYEDYAAGVPATRIAARLNADGVPSPRGGKWSVVTIAGHYDRGDGILQNAVYRGLLVWGRCPETRHPVTARRQVRARDEAEWVTQEAPHLRIVDDDLWFRVQRMRAARRQRQGGRRVFTPFDLECRCARCGGDLIRVEQPYLVCAAFKRHRTCTADRRYAVAGLTTLLFARLERLPPAEWRGWVADCGAAHGRIREAHTDLETRIAEASTRLDRLIELIADGLTTSDRVREHILATEQAVERLTAEWAALGHCPHPSTLDRTALRAAVKAATTPEQRERLVTGVLHAVTLDRDADGDMLITAMEPDFAAVAALAGGPDHDQG